MPFRQFEIQFFANFPRADRHEGAGGPAGPWNGSCLAGRRNSGDTRRLAQVLRRLLLDIVCLIGFDSAGFDYP